MQVQQLMQGQQVVVKILGKCFTRCVDSPGESLSKKQQDCIWSCTKSIYETEQYISRRLEGIQSASHTGK